MNRIKNIIIKYKAYIICIIIIVLSILSIIIQDIDRKNALKVNNKEANQESNKIAVYISGAVKTPGVYYLEKNARVYNLLDICGGIAENADITKLNLAQKLVDEDKIEIPVKIEKNESDSEDTTIDDVNISEENQLVNINTASETELTTLNGIGDATAKKIIDYRDKNGKFDTIEDIMEVPGIGESKFNNIKESICVK